APAADASARQRTHYKKADPYPRGHERSQVAVRIAHDTRLRRGARRNAGRRSPNRTGRTVAERDDRRRVHRLRRRWDRLQDGWYPEIFDRDVLLRVELRRGHESRFLGQAAS